MNNNTETIEQKAEQSFKTHHIGQQDLAQDIYEDGFKEGYNTYAETHTLSDDEVVEFFKWAYDYVRFNETDLTSKELLTLFKEQLPKTIYYE